MKFESDIRREKQLAETRAANPGRPVYVDSVTGCVVVGPTLDEMNEVREMMDQDERIERERLKQPRVARDLIRRVDDPDEPVFGSKIRCVFDVYDANVSESFRGSSAWVIARVRNKRRTFIIFAGESQDNGTRLDPPDYDCFIDELKCPKIKPLRSEKTIENNGCDSTDIEHVEENAFKCRACGLTFKPQGLERRYWNRSR